MKNIIKLGMLAALATVSAHAVSVDFTTPTYNAIGPTSITKDGVVVSGYIYAGGWTNTGVTVAANSLGIGVLPASQAADPYAVEGNQVEFLLINFAGTATGNVQINTLTLNFPTKVDGSVAPSANPYFRYAWLSSAPTGTTPYPGGPFDAGGAFALTQLTPVTSYTGSAPTDPSDLYNFAIPGQGSYLLLQAINGTYTTSNMFQLNSLTYTSVPDGASTLALMGAALATLGFAGRRRKA